MKGWRLAIAAMAPPLAGGILGYLLLGNPIRNSLQVEPPGSRHFEEYRNLHAAASWIGAAIGIVGGFIVAGAVMIGWALHRRHRNRSRASSRNSGT